MVELVPRDQALERVTVGLAKGVRDIEKIGRLHRAEQQQQQKGGKQFFHHVRIGAQRYNILLHRQQKKASSLDAFF